MDWVIEGPGVENGRWVAPRDSIFRAKLVPSQLFEAVEDVTSTDGKPLIPAKMQLVRMASSKPMICTLVAGADDTLSFKNRVCLLDSNADGSFESYFLKGLGRADFTTDRMWFAMNSRIPKNQSRTGVVDVREIDKSLLSTKPEILLNYDEVRDSTRKILLSARVEGFGPFISSCDAHFEKNSDTKLSTKCGFPGATVIPVDRNGESIKFRILPNETATRLRFSASFGIVDRKITGFYFF